MTACFEGTGGHVGLMKREGVGEGGRNRKREREIARMRGLFTLFHRLTAMLQEGGWVATSVWALEFE